MDRKTALHLLKLSEPATSEQIEQSYNNIYSGLKTRIGQGSPQIKKMLEGKLEELEQARLLLLKDYPSISPVTPIQSNINEAIINNASFTDEEYKVVKKWRSIFLLTTILALVLAGFFLAKWLNSNTLIAEQKKTIIELESFKKYASHFQNRDFKIQNIGNEDFYLVYYKVFYMEGDSILQEFEHTPDKLIKAGSTFNEMVGDGVNRKYDGKAIFYNIIVDSEDGNESKSFSGITDDSNLITCSPNFQK